MNGLKEKSITMSDRDLHFDAVIVGLGKTGLSCVRYLSKQGLKLAVLDSRDNPPELGNYKNEFDETLLHLGEIDVNILLAADMIVLSPGLSMEDAAIKQAIDAGIPVYGDIELFCQQAKAPIIAITGSNGKSTVTTLVGEMAQQAGINVAVGGNLGTPVLDLLDDDDCELYVLELSSFQLETTFSLKAHASVILNLSPDHLDRYKSFDDYANAKKKIYTGSQFSVINEDDPHLNNILVESRQRISFSLSTPVNNEFGLIKDGDDVWLCQGTSKIIRLQELGMAGQHNIANALAAMALASTINISHEAMAKVLKEFNGLAHRCQKVATINKVTWFNDSKATNVGSCVASINGLAEQGKIILIAGGDSKGADMSGLSNTIMQHVKHVLLMGIDAEKIAAIVDKSIPVTFTENMDEAVSLAGDISSPGDIVLLAPACASFDMFNNYQHRGETFVAAVRALESCK